MGRAGPLNPYPEEMVQQFRGGLVFKAHRLLYHSTLGLRVLTKKRRPHTRKRRPIAKCGTRPGSRRTWLQTRFVSERYRGTHRSAHFHPPPENGTPVEVCVLWSVSPEMTRVADWTADVCVCMDMHSINRRVLRTGLLTSVSVWTCSSRQRTRIRQPSLTSTPLP